MRGERGPKNAKMARDAEKEKEQDRKEGKEFMR